MRLLKPERQRELPRSLLLAASIAEKECLALWLNRQLVYRPRMRVAAGGAGPVSMIVTLPLVNLRHALYSATLGQSSLDPLRAAMLDG